MIPCWGSAGPRNSQTDGPALLIAQVTLLSRSDLCVVLSFVVRVRNTHRWETRSVATAAETRPWKQNCAPRTTLWKSGYLYLFNPDLSFKVRCDDAITYLQHVSETDVWINELFALRYPNLIQCNVGYRSITSCRCDPTCHLWAALFLSQLLKNTE